MISSGKFSIRRKRKFKCPNPLFEEWLTEWRDAAVSKGLNSRYNFAKALSSLKKYPLPLSSGREAKILEHFGDKICKMLDERLEKYKAQPLNSQINAVSNTMSFKTDLNYHAKSQKGSSKLKSSANKKEKLRKISSTLTKLSPSKSISQPSAQLLPVPLNVIPTPMSYEPIIPTEQNEDTCDLANENGFALYPGQFDIFLCVDNCETLSGHSKSRKKFLEELKAHGMEFLTRKLNVGDFLWIAKEKSSFDSSADNTKELVLDFVIERKRLDDLAHSIKDGRFREQKFRLKMCGLKRPIYLVEHHKQGYIGLPESTLEQAIVNTQIVDGFTVKRTKDIKESVVYLASMTKYIQCQFQNRVLKSASREEMEKSSLHNLFLTFPDFNRGSVKNKVFTISEMFIKHLLQFHGISPDRAGAIVDRFKTPMKFFESLESCATENEKAKLLSDIKYGKYQKPIGQAIGKVLQQYYTPRSNI